jgi:hypothetical protein
MQDSTNRRYWGQGLVPIAHGGRLFRDERLLVAEKMVKLVDSSDRTIKLQLKFTKRSTTFASLTLVLIF